MTPTLQFRPSRAVRHRCAAAIVPLAWLVLLSACGKPPLPEKERPPEPQAASHTELRDAIHAPIDRARAVEADTLEAAQAQRDAIEAATGG